MGRFGSHGDETEGAICSFYPSSSSVWLIDLAASPAGPQLQDMASQALPWTLCSWESQGIVRRVGRVGKVGQGAAELPVMPLGPLGVSS